MKRSSHDIEGQPDLKVHKPGISSSVKYSESSSKINLKLNSSLSVHPSHYSSKFPFYREPSEIGCFSLDSKRQFHHNNSQLRYCVLPDNLDRVQFDLNQGYAECIKRDETVKDYIDDMLRWISHNKHKFLLAQTKDSNKWCVMKYVFCITIHI